jgi:hypothetical protein
LAFKLEFENPVIEIVESEHKIEYFKRVDKIKKKNEKDSSNFSARKINNHSRIIFSCKRVS